MWHFQHHVTRENISNRVWGGWTKNISYFLGDSLSIIGHNGCVARWHTYYQGTSLRGLDSNMSLYPGRLSVHTGSYWVVVKWHFQHHATRENIANRVWGGRTQNISLLPERLTVHYGSYGVGSQTTQLFWRNKSDGVGFKHESISQETFCSYWVILGSG